MKNVTNNLKNLSLPRDKRKYNLEVSYQELLMLRSIHAAATNHPSLPTDDPVFISLLRQGWDTLNHLIQNEQARTVYRDK